MKKFDTVMQDGTKYTCIGFDGAQRPICTCDEALVKEAKLQEKEADIRAKAEKELAAEEKKAAKPEKTVEVTAE